MLLTLLLLGQAFPPGTGQNFNSDSSRIERIARVTRPYGRTAGLAFFEFAPTSGAGLGAPCSPPNYVLNSDSVAGGGWVAPNLGAAALTATLAFSGVATRLQIPATTAGQYSLVGKGGGCLNNTQTSLGMLVQGNGTSGTVDLCNGDAPLQCAPCAYTSTGFTQCTLLGVNTTGGGNYYFGNATAWNGGIARGAADVLVKAAQCSPGATLGAYTSTVAATAGPPVTGAKGEAVTWTRASGAYCTKSASESSIANGDLVYMANNQPRVMSLGGPLGVLVESSRVNSTIRSQEFNDAAYTDSITTSTAPVLNGADTGVAPDGTTTADAYTFPATTAGQASARVQAGGCPATNATGTVYVKGQSGSGAMDVCAGTGGCFTCNFTNTAWTRCGGFSATAANFYVGNMTAFNGGAARASSAVYLWGAQCEAGAYATSYIPTTTVAVTRSADFGTVPVAVTQQPISLAWTSGVVLPASVTPDRIGVMTRALAGSGDFIASYFQTQYRVDAVGTASNSVTLAGISAVGDRWAASHVGGVLTVYKNGVQTGTATLANTLTGATILGIGSSPAGASILDGVVSRICVDPDPNRCR